MSLRKTERRRRTETVAQGEARNKVIAVWSAAGSVGRSHIAAGVAVELASSGFRTLLIDADVIAPSQVQLFGFSENHIGIASACRLASRGELSTDALSAMLLEYQMPKASIWLLPGLHLVSRWPELGFQPMLELIEFAAAQFDYVVIDTSALLERELVDQRSLAERFAVTHAVLQAANQIVAICPADSIGLSRYVWGVQELKQLGHSAKLLTLVNRLPQASGKLVESLDAALERLAGLRAFGYLPEDCELFTRANQQTLPINLVPKNSSVKQSLATFIRGRLLGIELTSRRLAKLG